MPRRTSVASASPPRGASACVRFGIDRKILSDSSSTSDCCVWSTDASSRSRRPSAFSDSRSSGDAFPMDLLTWPASWLRRSISSCNCRRRMSNSANFATSTEAPRRRQFSLISSILSATKRRSSTNFSFKYFRQLSDSCKLYTHRQSF